MNMIHFRLESLNLKLNTPKTQPKSKFCGLKLPLSTTDDDEITCNMVGLLLIRDRSLRMTSTRRASYISPWLGLPLADISIWKIYGHKLDGCQLDSYWAFNLMNYFKQRILYTAAYSTLLYVPSLLNGSFFLEIYNNKASRCLTTLLPCLFRSFQPFQVWAIPGCAV